MDPQLETQLVTEGVDVERMIVLLNDLNAGRFESEKTGVKGSIPDISHPSIIDRRAPAAWKMDIESARSRFEHLGLPFSPESAGILSSGFITFDEPSLRKIGIYLYPKTAFGLLNGGCASSYTDLKSNRALNAAALEANRVLFTTLARKCRGKPKGLTAAYINPDGSSGFSFLLLKLRMLLQHKKQYQALTGLDASGVLPAFQLTSFHTEKAIHNAFRKYIMYPELKTLSDSLGCPAIDMYTETQSLMAAITHSSEGSPRRIFDRARGRMNTGIPLPGGHGQNFENLAHIYRKMYKMGIRYAWIGNIDNMGYTADPVSLAIFALSGKEAAFEESFRTSMDIKGGILVTDETGHFTCAEIGAVLSSRDIAELEGQGKPVLFNCGIGLFDLEKLLPMLPGIPQRLPHRVTDQDKAAGRYAQIEQNTWEIIGLLNDPLFLAVEKTRRFIASKLLLETILTSMPPDKTPSSEIAAISQVLHSGLTKLLESEYGLELVNNCWRCRFCLP